MSVFCEGSLDGSRFCELLPVTLKQLFFFYSILLLHQSTGGDETAERKFITLQVDTEGLNASPVIFISLR